MPSGPVVLVATSVLLGGGNAPAPSAPVVLAATSLPMVGGNVSALELKPPDGSRTRSKIAPARPIVGAAASTFLTAMATNSPWSSTVIGWLAWSLSAVKQPLAPPASPAGGVRSTQQYWPPDRSTAWATQVPEASLEQLATSV